jgi:hypothetical protein
MISDPQLTEFQSLQKTYLGKSRTVYCLGDSGPGVVLMARGRTRHE